MRVNNNTKNYIYTNLIKFFDFKNLDDNGKTELIEFIDKVSDYECLYSDIGECNRKILELVKEWNEKHPE